jgi:hypothetical protein
MPASTHAVTCSRQRAARRKTRAELYYLHQCYNRELISATVTGPWGVMHTRSRARGQPTFVWPDVASGCRSSEGEASGADRGI